MLRRTNPHRDQTDFERALEEMRDLGEVYEPQPFPRPTVGMAMKAAASKSKSAYRDRWGRVRMLTEAQAATLPYRAYQKVASNPKSSRAAEKALEHAAAAAIEELRGMIKRRKTKSNPAQTLRQIEPDRGVRRWKVADGRTVRDPHGHTHLGERPGVPAGYPGVRWYVTRPGQPEVLYTVLYARDVDEAAEHVRTHLEYPDMMDNHFPAGTTHRLEPQRPAERRISRKNNPSPVPGISVEEVIADVQGEEWANWDYNRAGIMHWR
jgi:hypothetical protein